MSVRERKGVDCAESPKRHTASVALQAAWEPWGAMRYVAVLRKISGQVKGGAEYMRNMSNFASCVLTWRNQGKSAAGEAAKLV